MASPRAGLPDGPGGGPTLPPSAAVLAKAPRENFTVASLLLPRPVRGHLMAIYGFARLVDDVGDELAGNRLEVLDALEAEIDRIYRGDDPAHRLLRRLAATVRDVGIPAEPLRQLVEANRLDQKIRTYETYEGLLSYCELSANPVGRLVLHVLGLTTAERIRLSDAICTGLQLVEHWQDVREDLDRGRVYLPAEDLVRFGVTWKDLAAPRSGGPLRRLLAFEVDRAEGLLRQGAPLVQTIRGRARIAVAGFVAGGLAAVAAIRRAGHDVLPSPPRPSRARTAVELLRVLGGA